MSDFGWRITTTPTQQKLLVDNRLGLYWPEKSGREMDYTKGSEIQWYENVR